jgi:hypothetical protein
MKILLSAVGLIALTAVNGVQAQARVWICEKDGTRFFAETTGCPVGTTFIDAPLQGRVWTCERADGVEFFSEYKCPSGTTIVRKPTASRTAQSSAPAQPQTQRSTTDSSRPKTSPAGQSNAGNPACPYPASKVESDLKAELAKLHPDSYFVQSAALDKDMQSYRTLCAMTVIPEMRPVFERVFKMHYPRYFVMLAVVENEMKARERLR